ncbi:MAG: PA14 domain-containing protein [Gammaproteobacteria bacterium]
MGLGHDVTGMQTWERAVRASGPPISDAERSASLCSPSSPAGVGLFGEYFGQAGLRGTPVLTRIDEVIDFDESFDWPASSDLPRARSIRWTGWVRTPFPGRYRFHLAAVNTRISVSRQIVAENGISISDGIDLVVGRYYPIAVEIESLPAGVANFRLEWTAPFGARYIVPKPLLYLPTERMSRT